MANEILIERSRQEEKEQQKNVLEEQKNILDKKKFRRNSNTFDEEK